MFRAVNRMNNKIILVTGGCKSGKSKFAESLLKYKDNVAYIATAIVTDKEMESRIKEHKNSRNNKWITIEQYKNLDIALNKIKEDYILLDCVTAMITNLMFEEYTNFDLITKDKQSELLEKIKNEFLKLIKSSKELNKNVIIVTNEVGYSLTSEYRLGRIFTDFTGSINQLIASFSDEVYLVSCGIPIKLK